MKYIFCQRQRRFLPPEQAVHRDPGARRPVNVMRDQPGFRSPIDGTWLEGRADIRRHEREHGVTQVGNDIKPPRRE